MAEEFVGKDQFAEFTKRMELGFDHVSQRFDHVSQRFDHVSQRFDHMNQRMDQGFNHVNQRFDDLKTDMAGIRADMRQMRNWLVGLYSIVVFGFIGTLVITIFKEQIFK